MTVTTGVLSIMSAILIMTATATKSETLMIPVITGIEIISGRSEGTLRDGNTAARRDGVIAMRLPDRPRNTVVSPTMIESATAMRAPRP
jgi:hypothetical protein